MARFFFFFFFFWGGGGVGALWTLGASGWLVENAKMRSEKLEKVLEN